MLSPAHPHNDKFSASQVDAGQWPPSRRPWTIEDKGDKTLPGENDTKRRLADGFGGRGPSERNKLVDAPDPANTRWLVRAARGTARRFIRINFVQRKDQIDAGGKFRPDPIIEDPPQESRHWRVNSSLRPQANGLTQVELSAQDRAGQPLAGLEATVSLIHPNDRRLDRPIAMQPSAPGHFRGAVTSSPGQWDLIIELSRDGERLFRSRERVILR